MCREEGAGGLPQEDVRRIALSARDEFAKYVEDQLKHWGALIKQAGIKPE